MDFREDFNDHLRAVIMEHFKSRIEGSGLELGDFIETVLDHVDDAADTLCDLVIEVVDAELEE